MKNIVKNLIKKVSKSIFMYIFETNVLAKKFNSIAKEVQFKMSKHEVLLAIIGNLFTFSYMILLSIACMTTFDIILPQLILNLNNIWVISISLIGIVMYSLNAEIIYETKKQMRIAVYANGILYICGFCGLMNFIEYT